jgi:hypothetical protein
MKVWKDRKELKNLRKNGKGLKRINNRKEQLRSFRKKVEDKTCSYLC